LKHQGELKLNKLTSIAISAGNNKENNSFLKTNLKKLWIKKRSEMKTVAGPGTCKYVQLDTKMDNFREKSI